MTISLSKRIRLMLEFKKKKKKNLRFLDYNAKFAPNMMQICTKQHQKTAFFGLLYNTVENWYKYQIQE